MAFVSLLSSSEVLEGELKVIPTKHMNLIVTRFLGKVYAFEDACSHDGEEISCGKLEGSVITCPRHFAQFDIRTGEVLAFPATEPLVIFPTREVNDTVEVDFEG